MAGTVESDDPETLGREPRAEREHEIRLIAAGAMQEQNRRPLAPQRGAIGVVQAAGARDRDEVAAWRMPRLDAFVDGPKRWRSQSADR